MQNLHRGLEVSHVAASWQYTGLVMGRTFDPRTQMWGWSVAWDGFGPNGARACDQAGIYSQGELTISKP